MKQHFMSKLVEMKKNRDRISMLTAYDMITAKCLEESGVDVILVGDSLGQVFSGHHTTIPVTLTDMIYHTQVVRRGAPHTLVVIDMPFMTMRISLEKSKKNAMKAIQKTGANAIKFEINSIADVQILKAICDTGISVMAHIGFTPQYIVS